MQALSSQTTIATSEDMVVLAGCSSNGKTANLHYIVSNGNLNTEVQSFHANKCNILRI